MTQQVLAGPDGGFLGRLRRRRAVDRFATVVAVVFAFAATYPLFSVLWKVASLGWDVMSIEFLTERPTSALRAGGGIRHAIVGSLMVVGLGTAMGAPGGFLAGIYLSEFGRGRFADAIRTVVNAMAGLPSIIAGVIGYIVVVLRVGHYNAYAGGFALALLMLPVVTRTTEEALRTVPRSYREAALALGAPKWRSTLTVVVPAAFSGLLTGLLLAVARIAGETAPLLLTVSSSFFLVTNPNEPIATLPVLIYTYATESQPKLIQHAWGAAFVLLLFVLTINIAVRLLTYRRRRAG